MNSIIIYTLRKRSKSKILESSRSTQRKIEIQSLKRQHFEKQVFTMLLLVTFMYLIFTVTMRAFVFYGNFYTGNTASYYAGLHLIHQVGTQAFYTNHAINFFLYVLSDRKFRTDLMNLFIPVKTNKNEIRRTTSNKVLFWMMLFVLLHMHCCQHCAYLLISQNYH